MKSLASLALLVLCALLVPAALAEAPPIVVVLSWDGMRHDYPDRGEFPALKRVENEGVRVGRLTPVFPSSTFPGHVSMATGTYPDRHGIVDNVFVDAQRGRYAYSGDASWLEAEPLWIASERQGVKTATYFWVGSESDWQGLGTSYRITPFDGERPESEKVDQILAWLALPETARPRLIMSYWAGADSVGHDDGPEADSVVEQIQSQDAQLGRLLSGIDALGLWPRTTLIIVSDHGMTAATKALDLNEALADAGIDAVSIGSSVAKVHLKSPAPDAEVRAVLEDYLADVPGAGIYKPAALPDHYRLKRDSRLGDWVVVVPPPYAFFRVSGFEGLLMRVALFFGKSFGMHGYDPSHADMSGIFLAMGRGVPDAAPSQAHQIDLAATVAALLEIEPPRDSEGKSIW